MNGHDVVTIEGLSRGGALNALQRAFVDRGALQCGYCTSGMIMTAQALLLSNPNPSREAIGEALENNLCRCGAHQRILNAIEAAASRSGRGS